MEKLLLSNQAASGLSLNLSTCYTVKKKHYCACLPVRRNGMFETPVHDSRVAPPVETMSPHHKQCSDSKIHFFLFFFYPLYLHTNYSACLQNNHLHWFHAHFRMDSNCYTIHTSSIVIGSKSHTWVRAKYYYGTSETQQRCLISNILLILKVISNTIT